MRFHRLWWLVLASAIAGISSNTFHFENLRRGLGNKIIPNIKHLLSDSYAHPAPLPSTADPKDAALAAVATPYKNIIQGTRRKGDVRVYNEDFFYAPKQNGHLITLRAEVDCQLACLTAESTDGIPIILRGGAGHSYFTVVVKAKPGRTLKGRVRGYCRKGQGPALREELNENLKARRKIFVPLITQRTTTDTDKISENN